MYFLGVFQNIGDTIEQALRSLMGQLSATIYTLIESMYLLFNYLAKAEILDNEFITEIYRKVGLLLGIFMIFKLSFSLIQSLINPEKLTDKKTGFTSIIGRCILSIVLLGITPSLFREAFKIQNYLVGGENKNNIIYKLIVGKSVSGNFETMGRVIAGDIYFTFFTDDDNNLNKGIKDVVTDNDFEYYDRFKTDNYANLKASVENREMSFYDTLQYLTVKENGQYVIEYNWLLSILFGVVFLYLMFTYCIQTATRVIQLAYLQLIAPVPILSYISNPDGAFKNWLKQCSTTFLDLFIRLAIIYFSMSVIDNVIEQFNKAGGIIFESTGVAADNELFKALIKIFIILGLLMFAKRAPELLKELFPNLGGGAASLGFGLKSPKKTLEDIPILGGAANKVLGYAGNAGKKAGKWAWSKTGGKGINAIKGKYGTWKDDRAGYKEGYKKDKESEKAWKEYGNDFNVDPSASPEEKLAAYKKAFRSDRDKTGEYAASYAELEIASNALKNYKGDTNSADYRKLLADKEKAQKNHDVNREKYKELARREDQLKRYANRHPEVKKNTSSASTSSSSSTTSTQQQSQQFNNSTPIGSTQEQKEQYINKETKNEKFEYHPSKEWDERIEYATEKLQELANNGADQDEIENQRKILENLEKGKSHSVNIEKSSKENADLADEEFRDSWASEGRADDSDNW